MQPEKQASMVSSILQHASSIDSYVMTHRKCFENKEISGIQLFFDVDQNCMRKAIEAQEENL